LQLAARHEISASDVGEFAGSQPIKHPPFMPQPAPHVRNARHVPSPLHAVACPQHMVSMHTTQLALQIVGTAHAPASNGAMPLPPQPIAHSASAAITIRAPIRFMTAV
jgi:hypothetical protein